MTAIDEIKARVDIVELISETVKLRRSGKSFSGFCPFHANTRTPAFVVFPDSGTWRCFGQCNEGGDIFRFVMKKEGWDFPTALQYLAQRAGVTLEAPSPQRQADEDAHDRLRALLEEAVIFYRHNLTNTTPGKQAMQYLVSRGLTAETVESFGLGYAPDGWESACQYFTAKGFSQHELLEAGLVTQRQEEQSTGRGGVYDRFRHRVMFPIRDMQGRMAGFGARILRPDDVPKFLNSPQTPLFDKGRLLYGLDRARKPIRAREQVVIVEGYLDVIVLHQCGYTNTVSPMGTALTEDQLRLIKRFTHRVVLALDADAAGHKATLRGLEIARQAMDHEQQIGFDARGLLRNERRLQADLRVTTIPEGMDPDEVALRNPQEWQTILDAAQPIVIHVMQTLAIGRDLEDPKVKSELAAQVLPLIEDVTNPVEREAYRQRLARFLKLDERALIGAQVQPARQPRRRRAEGQPAVAGQAAGAAAQPVKSGGDLAARTRELESHILRLLLRQPDALYLLDRVLQSFSLTRFGMPDFDHTDHQLIFKQIQLGLEQDGVDPGHHIVENMPDSLMGYADELRSPFERGEPETDELNEDLVRSVVRLRHLRVMDGMSQLRFLQEEMQQQGETHIESYREAVLQYTQTLSRLNQVLNQPLQVD